MGLLPCARRTKFHEAAKGTCLGPVCDCMLASDGDAVLIPRLHLAFDVIPMVSIYIFLAAASAVNRIGLALTWSLIKSTLLYEPVLPDWLALYDNGFMTFAATLKARAGALSDPELTAVRAVTPSCLAEGQVSKPGQARPWQAHLRAI